MRGPWQRGFLFDLDGVLLDTTRLVAANWHAFTAERGLALDDERLARLQGRRTVDALIEEFGFEATDARAIATTWTDARRLSVEARGLIPPIPGTVAFIRACLKAGLRTALVSSATAGNVAYAQAVTGLTGAFGAVISAADVSRGKPDPEPYLAAADRLGLDPARAVAVEDSPPGIAAARAAGARVIALATTFATSREVLASADLVLDDLDGADPLELIRLLDRSVTR